TLLNAQPILPYMLPLGGIIFEKFQQAHFYQSARKMVDRGYLKLLLHNFPKGFKQWITVIFP
ncbi:MAG: hypothetical protein FGF50_03685, partial [Candidatus Brockarchaeota archaeon]|nr:hypothetical protein [Candidatus Brockarchaeota archaeon]